MICRYNIYIKYFRMKSLWIISWFVYWRFMLKFRMLTLKLLLLKFHKLTSRLLLLNCHGLTSGLLSLKCHRLTFSSWLLGCHWMTSGLIMLGCHGLTSNSLLFNCYEMIDDKDNYKVKELLWIMYVLYFINIKIVLIYGLLLSKQLA